MTGKVYEEIILTPDSSEAHKPLPLRNARTYCEGHGWLWITKALVQTNKKIFKEDKSWLFQVLGATTTTSI